MLAGHQPRPCRPTWPSVRGNSTLIISADNREPPGTTWSASSPATPRRGRARWA